MVSASSLQGAPRPLHGPWPWNDARREPPGAPPRPRARTPKTHDLAGLLIAVAFHVALLGLALVAPKNALTSGFWVPVEPAIEVDLEDTPAAAAPACERPEARAPECDPSVTPLAPPVRAGEVRAALSRLPTLPDSAARGRNVSRARMPLPEPSLASVPAPASGRTASEYDGPPPPLPFSSNGLSLFVMIPGSPDLATSTGTQAGTDSGSAAPSSKGAVQGQGQSAGASKSSPKPVVDRAIATKLLAESLGERDKDLGLTLPAAGNVASALQSAVRSALGPAAGSATFLAILTPSGQILGISPVAMNGGTAEAWTTAAQSALAALSGRSFAMVAPFRNGAVVWVDVTSSFVLPSGAAAPVSGEPGGFRFDLSDIGRGKQQVIRTKIRVAAVK